MRLSCCEEGRAELRVCPFVPAGGLGAREGARGRQRAQRACRWTNEVRPLNSCPPPHGFAARAGRHMESWSNETKASMPRCDAASDDRIRIVAAQ